MRSAGTYMRVREVTRDLPWVVDLYPVITGAVSITVHHPLSSRWMARETARALAARGLHPSEVRGNHFHVSEYPPHR